MSDHNEGPDAITNEATWYVGDEPLHDETLAALEASAVYDEVVEQRRKVYGDVIEAHVRIAQVWSGLLGHEVKPTDVPAMMMGLKLVRASHAPDYSDNTDDIEGYLGIYREIVGEDMIHARSVTDYVEQKMARGDLL